MSIKSAMSRWLPPAISDRMGLVKKSMIPTEAWKFWGLRRNSRLLAEDAYEKVGWVYGAVRAIARNAQQIELYAAMSGSGGKVKRLPDSHALSQLLKRPNAEEDMSGIMESTVTHLNLRGEAFWELDGQLAGDNGLVRPANLYSRPPQWLWKVDIENDRYARYHMRVPTLGDQIVIDGSMGMFFKFYNPRDPWRGLAPMAAAYQAADTYYAASLVNAKFFDNGAMPSIVMKYDKDAGIEELSDVQRDRLRTELQVMYSGFQNAHAVAVLGPGESFDKISPDLKDMDFQKLMMMNREEILAVFGVPPIELGYVESANRANSDNQRRLFWEEIIIPTVEDVISMCNRKLSPRFGPGVFVAGDYGGVPALRKDLQATAAGVIPFVTAGAYTINEVRADFLDKPPVEWGDEWWHPSINVPTDEDGTTLAPVMPKPAGGSQQTDPKDPDDPRDKEEQQGKMTGVIMRNLMLEWKNAAVSRIREGARSPLEAFPPGREANKAHRKFGLPRQAARDLAKAVHIELAISWDTTYPEAGAAELFERTIDAIPAGSEGATLPRR